MGWNEASSKSNTKNVPMKKKKNTENSKFTVSKILLIKEYSASHSF